MVNNATGYEQKMTVMKCEFLKQQANYWM